VSLVAALRDGLAALADADKAGPMQAYMKSAMPFRGVQSPQRRRLVRDVLAAHGPPASREEWVTTVRELWDGADYREERYVAIDLCAHRSARPWQDPDAVAMYDHFVVSGAWWDLVDPVATRLVGPILRAAPGAVEPVVRGWIRDPDRWRRRAAVIAQIGAKSATDTALLADAVIANVADPDFFLRKGIGWALRAYAKTDPSWVCAFVDAHRHELSPLSLREATKHLGGTD
jgi:3-methyladenine DNA glycosylase AlkD